MMVEVMVAVAIVAASIFTCIFVSNRAVFIARQSVYTTQASFLLEEGAEVVRIVRDNAWTNISGLTVGTDYYPNFTGGTWTLSSTSPNPSQTGIYTRTVAVAAVNRDNITADISATGTDDPGTKMVTVTVSWPEGGTTLSKSLKFYISNIFL